MKHNLLFALYFLVIINYSFAQDEGGKPQEVKTFSLVQYEDGGVKRWELNGRSAEINQTKVKIDEVSLLAFGDNTILKLKARIGDFDRERNLVHLQNDVIAKTTDGTILTTDSLYWDTKTKNAFTGAVVNIKKADFEVDAEGAVCDLEKKTAELRKDVTANIKSSEDALLGTTNDERRTTITCDGPLEVNYKKNRATFLNNVTVEDARAHIYSDRMDVYFGKDTRRIRCVVARGNVRIVNGESVTYSEKAIYLVDRGKVVLPKRPKLVIENKNEDYKQ